MSRSFQSLPLVVLSFVLAGTPVLAQDGGGAQLQADVQHQLNKKQFRDVQAQVSGGTVTLTGTVDLLADKLDAEKRVAKTHEASTITNQITVNAGEISDQQIYNKLGKALAFDRQGYGSYPFNSIGLQVQNGIVLLTGEVVEPVDKDSALSLATNTKGVRGLVDRLKVAPTSPMDWQIRRAMYQAVYGSSVGTKYAIDPGKPIRIVVDNGHVTLVGVVLNTGDKDIIGVRAQTVPNVFSVANELQVAGQGREADK